MKSSISEKVKDRIYDVREYIEEKAIYPALLLVSPLVVMLAATTESKRIKYSLREALNLYAGIALPLLIAGSFIYYKLNQAIKTDNPWIRAGMVGFSLGVSGPVTIPGYALGSYTARKLNRQRLERANKLEQITSNYST